MDVGKGFDVSHVAVPNIKRRRASQILWALLCLTLLALRFVKESRSETLLVSLRTQP